MPASKLSSLRESLVAHYDELKKRLSYRLGNADQASDALHDAYLRLQSEDASAAESASTSVAHPVAYLYRMAFHIAVDDMRTAERRLTTGEIDDLLEMSDPAPGPQQIAQGRQDLALMLEDLEALPRRQREILLAVRLDGTSREKLAERYRISLRTVDRELEKGYAFCLQRMRRE